MSSLSEAYVEHLRAPRVHAAALAKALTDSGLPEEGALVQAWAAGRPAHAGVALGSTPPAERSVGARWFDPCELMTHVYTGRAWLSERPVERWQMHGFLTVATRVPRVVQLAPPYLAFDAARLTPPGDERARCTSVTQGEATLYAWWLRKAPPHWLDWQLLLEDHPWLLPRLGVTAEWCAGGLMDEGERIAMSPLTVGRDPDETPEMRRGELTRDPAIGFRTQVLDQIGLLEEVTSWFLNVEPVQLTGLIDRARFDPAR